MNKKLIGLVFAAALIALVLLLLIPNPLKGGLEYKAKPFEAGVAVVSSLFVIALFIERGVAVIYALIFGDKLQEAELDLALAFDDPGRDEKAALQKLAEELNFKERLRILLTFAGGLFVSVGGARTLEGLLVAHVAPGAAGRAPTLLPDLHPWFPYVDVVLTAGLIAGGSNALAFIIALLKSKVIGDGSRYAAARERLTTTT